MGNLFKFIHNFNIFKYISITNINKERKKKLNDERKKEKLRKFRKIAKEKIKQVSIFEEKNKKNIHFHRKLTFISI